MPQSQPPHPSYSPALHADHLPDMSASGISGSGEGMDGELPNRNRASVLSFQTAISGGNHNGNNSNAHNDGDERLMEQLDGAPPKRPWLHQGEGSRTGLSSYSTSPDERNFPGGWQNRTWSQDEGGRSPRQGPMPSGQQRRRPSQSPRVQLIAVDDHDDQDVSFTSAHQSAPTPPEKSPHSSPEQTPARRQSTRMPPSPAADKDLPSQPVVPTAAAAAAADGASILMPSKGHGTPSGNNLRAPPLVTSSSEVSTAVPARAAEMHTADLPATATGKEGKEYVPNSDSAADVSVLLDGDSRSKGERTTPDPKDSKESPPVPSKKEEVGLSSPPLSEEVIPSPPAAEKTDMDTSEAEQQASIPTAPVSDFRAKPLVQIEMEPHDAATPYRDDAGTGADARRSPTSERMLAPGVGAHAAHAKSGEGPPAFAAMMRNGAAGATPAPPRATYADNTQADPEETEGSPSLETPPREPSPPPEGEVEARAEWERAQMRQLVEKSKANANSSRKTTFRGQLKPLQLVAAEESKRSSRISSPRSSDPLVQAAVADEPAALVKERAADGAVDGASRSLPNKNAPGVLSTQQLQRQSARDQRRSASTINLAMGVSEIGGAYPVFASPPLNASNGTNGGARKYLGILPQRSLVPPFELQNRPDGLPSGLIGPDGVRKSPHDPDVCLECMMRDEDMIDVHVVGAKLWERESDKDFDEACRIEVERDAAGSSEKGRKTRTEGSSSTHGGTFESNANGADGQAREPPLIIPTKLTKIRVKRVAKGDPLTAERLKLHTQMNPPASSHRWRTLQVFLATQAKYIANEQRARGITPHLPPVPPKNDPDASMVRAQAAESRRAVSGPTPVIRLDERVIAQKERLAKEKDLAAARELRRRNAASTPVPQSPVSSAPRSRAPSAAMLDSPIVEDLESAQDHPARQLGKENSAGHQSIPRRTNANVGAFGRAGSAQDLRNIQGAMLPNSPTDVPPSPASLAPPTAPFRAATPQTFVRSGRAASSQLSLAPSASMIDMHVGGEDRKEHRISQAGFLPGTPLHTTSPSAFNRAYYGFPGDGDMNDDLEWEHQPPRQDQYLEGGDANYVSQHSEDRKRKKASSGIRGFFNKLSGKDASPDPSRERPDMNEQGIAPPNLSEGSRRSSMGVERVFDLQKPPNMTQLMGRARRSTSSLLNAGTPSGRPSMDSAMLLGGTDRSAVGVYTQPPGMGSQASLEMGPFGSGPQPPPRRESRDPEEARPRPSLSLGGQEAASNRPRTFSGGNFLGGGKRRIPNVANLPVSSRDESANLDSPVTSTYGRQRSAASQTLERYRKASPSLSQEFPRNGGNPSAREAARQSYLAGESQPRSSMSAMRTLDYEAAPRRSMQQQPADQSRSMPLMRLPQELPVFPEDTRELENVPKRPPRSPFRNSPSQPNSEGPLDGDTDVSNDVVRGDGPAIKQGRSQSAFQQQPAPGCGARFDTDYRSTTSGDVYEPYGGNDSHASTRSGFISGPPTPPTATQPRKSRLLKLPFGKSKRDSAIPQSLSSKANGYGKPASNDTPSLRSRSSRGTVDDSFNGMSASNSLNGPRQQPRLSMTSNGLRSSKSREMMSSLFGTKSRTPDEYGQFEQPVDAAHMTDGRSQQHLRPPSQAQLEPLQQEAPSKPWMFGRRTSNQIEDRSTVLAGLPPRSRSALGMFDVAGFGGNDSSDELPRGGSAANFQHPQMQSGSDVAPPKGKRSFLPRLRTSSRAALRSVDED